MITAIIPAAGCGRRMNANINKQFMSVAGQPVLTRALLSLADFTDEFVIVARSGEEEACREAARGIGNCKVVTGGATRQDSVYNGLKQARGEYVMVHDGSRPLVGAPLIRRVIAAAQSGGAAIPALPVVDTVKQVSGGKVLSTLPRHTLYAVQTPQVFDRELLLKAYKHAEDNGIQGTDDASLVESLGNPVLIVEGEGTNLKITTPEDIQRAESFLGQSQASAIRTGIGYDVHRLVPGRKLILGGVIIPFDRGLLGHSDADVLIHAIMDALLGAAALGDIGRHFPDTDQVWAGADSCALLARVTDMLREKGHKIINIDAVVIAQLPKISPYIPQMIDKITRNTKLESANINIKATTTEGLGFPGRGEGIAAQSVCTLISGTTGGL